MNKKFKQATAMSLMFIMIILQCIAAATVWGESLTASAENMMFSFRDSFNDYEDSTTLRESWTIPDGGSNDSVTLTGENGENKSLCIQGVNNTNTAKLRYVLKLFDKPLNDNKFVIEMQAKTSAPFQLRLVDTNGKQIQILRGSSSEIGCYTTEDEYETTSENVKFLTSEYKRIKLVVDKTQKKYTLVTAGTIDTFTYNYDIGDIKGIEIKVSKSSGKVEVNDISVKSYMDDKAVYANFEDNDFVGGMFYSFVAPDNGGISLNCAESVKNTVDGSTEYKINTAKGSIIVDVDKDTMSDIEDWDNIGVEIKYLDKGFGFIHLGYDTKDGSKELPAICMYNSGTNVSENEGAKDTKTQTYVLDDWVENSDTNGFRLKIKTYEGEIKDGSQLRSGERNYSKYPVVIKSVRIYNADTKSPTEIELSSKKTGNIFFEGDTPKINIDLKNRFDSQVNGSCNIKVYRKNKDDAYISTSERLVYNTSFDVRLAANETYDKMLMFPVEKFGLYRVEAEFVNDDMQYQSFAETEFSKCVQVGTLNKTVGVSSHLDQEGGADKALGLMKNIGMGLVREDFIWSDYETYVSGNREDGYETKFGLNDNMKAVCEAVDKYDMEMLLIVSGISWWHEGAYGNGGGFPSQTAIDYYFNDYVEHILKEPLIQKVCTMVEVWNEPDAVSQQNGEYLGDSSLIGVSGKETEKSKAEYIARGESYGKILNSVGKTIRRINREDNTNYKIGAFSLCSPWLPDTNYFMDAALSKLNPSETQRFDTITLHPYMWIEQDPEMGYGGSFTNWNLPMHYMGYKLDYVKALATGGSVYNYTNKKNEKLIGMCTNKTYSNEITEPLWITEYGLSSGDYNDDGLSAGSEYKQAYNMIRGYNQIKLNNFENKLWFYGLTDSGNRTNEKEHCFGLLRSPGYEVPYAAKIPYLAIAAMNKFIEGATSVSEVKSVDNNKYAVKYHGSERDAYMLWTTLNTEQTIECTELSNSANVKYYDILGNEISKASVMQNGKFKITREPFWAVKGEQPNFVTATEETDAGLFVLNSDGVGVVPNSEFDSDNISFVADFSGGGDKTMLTAVYKDGRLTEIKTYKPTTDTKVISFNQNANYVKFDGINSLDIDTTDYEYIKVMMFDNISKLTPLCTPIKINKT